DLDLDAALEHLHRHLARHTVRRKRPAARQREAHDLELVGLEQGVRRRGRQRAVAREEVDDLPGTCMGDGHRASIYFNGAVTPARDAVPGGKVDRYPQASIGKAESPGPRRRRASPASAASAARKTA